MGSKGRDFPYCSLRFPNLPNGTWKMGVFFGTWKAQMCGTPIFSKRIMMTFTIGFLRDGCPRGGGNWGTLRIPFDVLFLFFPTPTWILAMMSFFRWERGKKTPFLLIMWILKSKRFDTALKSCENHPFAHGCFHLDLKTAPPNMEGDRYDASGFFRRIGVSLKKQQGVSTKTPKMRSHSKLNSDRIW